MVPPIGRWQDALVDVVVVVDNDHWPAAAVAAVLVSGAVVSVVVAVVRSAVDVDQMAVAVSQRGGLYWEYCSRYAGHSSLSRQWRVRLG